MPIVCLQAGNVNTGACDDLRTGCALVHEHGGWVHVDGAFGLWTARSDCGAAASPATRHLVGSGVEPALADFTVESSRRARGFAVWAALRELGRTGVAELVDRCRALARRFADGLVAAGFEVCNEVVLNQVLVSFGEDARTDRMVEAVQQDGTCWMGGTTWRGRRLMRISVSNATTTEADIDRSLAAIRRLALQI